MFESNPVLALLDSFKNQKGEFGQYFKQGFPSHVSYRTFISCTTEILDATNNHLEIVALNTCLQFMLTACHI